MNNSIFDILMYFVIYSFLGWVLESIFRSICEKKIINTGFLYGPFCPIYGIGAIIMILGLTHFKGQYINVFAISFVVLTVWEYIVGWLLEKIFKTQYWDYSKHKFNIQGRVCLTNSFFWGILGMVFINFIHPFIQSKMLNLDIVTLKITIYMILVFMLVDAIICVIKVKNIKTTLQKVEELNKEIKEKLKEIKENKKYPDKEKMTENIQKMVDELKIKRNRIMRNLYRYVYRLKQAFPAINTKEITTILSKKLELKKNDIKNKHQKNNNS